MSTLKRPNIKLAKLFYKYMEEPNDQHVEEKEQPIHDETHHESYPPYNFSWLIENKIAAMGWPQTVANLNYLVDIGVNHLVTLSPERRPPIWECKKLKWTEIMVKEFGAPTLKQILKFIEICERAEIKGEVVGVHCHHGRGRTGTMLACYLVHFQNMAPERAVLTVRVQRPGSCETYEQEKIVCHYHDCVRGTIEKPDYRLVEDKLYFDFSMKYMDDEEEEKNNGTEDFGDSLEELNGYGTMRPRNIISSILSGTPAKNKGLAISNPHDFRMVSAIIDVDIVPETCRRVKLLKHGSDRPLGFFIRDGTSVRVTPNGVERSPGIFISRLVPGGLAESTGLLGVNDEVLEVNGIDVSNKTLDQVTDMMVANSSNLIITVRPANQRAGPPPPPETVSRNSQPSSEPDEDRFDQDEQDEIVDLTAVTLEEQPEPHLPHIPTKDDGQVLHL